MQSSSTLILWQLTWLLQTITSPLYTLCPTQSLHSCLAAQMCIRRNIGEPLTFWPGKAFVRPGLQWWRCFLWATRSCCSINLLLLSCCFIVWDDELSFAVSADLSDLCLPICAASELFYTVSYIWLWHKDLLCALGDTAHMSSEWTGHLEVCREPKEKNNTRWLHFI